MLFISLARARSLFVVSRAAAREDLDFQAANDKIVNLSHSRDESRYMLPEDLSTWQVQVYYRPDFDKSITIV